jgi:predicted enzyme related to lactoylglutathione lyase
MEARRRRRTTVPVLGVGGIFFRSSDPDALAAWYREHLGVGAGCAFDADTDYWHDDSQFILNLRVSELDDLLASLRAAGIDVVTKDEWDSPGTGRFARVHDPEGHAIELWEPPAD